MSELTKQSQEFQTLQAVVIGGCPNHCPYCIGRQNHSEAVPQLNLSQPENIEKISRKLAFARCVMGIPNLMITGRTADPMSSPRYLSILAQSIRQLDTPFLQTEIQTSGVTWTPEKLSELRTNLGVNTLALSLSDMFDSDSNAQINRTPERLRVDIDKLTAAVKISGLSLRLCINLSDIYSNRSYSEIFARAHELGADQLTLRALQAVKSDMPEARWISAHQYQDSSLEQATGYVMQNGRVVRELNGGLIVYDIHGIQTVADPNCLSRKPSSQVYDKGYAILDCDGELRTSWSSEEIASSVIREDDYI